MKTPREQVDTLIKSFSHIAPGDFLSFIDATRQGNPALLSTSMRLELEQAFEMMQRTQSSPTQVEGTEERKVGEGVKEILKSAEENSELNAYVPVAFYEKSDANAFQGLISEAGVKSSRAEVDGIGSWRVFVAPEDLEIAKSKIPSLRKHNIRTGGL